MTALDEFVFIEDDLLELATPEERALYAQYLERVAVEESENDPVDGWALWLRALFPSSCSAPFAEHHVDLWRWVWALKPDVRPEAFVAIWNRGGAKSTSAELAVAAVGARQRRRYVLYVCGTQALADEHVANIGTLLEALSVGRHYPEMARRAVGKYGNPRGWRRNRMATASGFTVDALGLDVASRGVKFDDQRPDLIVIDDVDDGEDTYRTVKRKISRLTRSLLPAGAPDLAVLAIQNLIHADSVFAQVLDKRVDMLARRIVSGPVPALTGCHIENREGRHVITAGEPTWEGLPLDACQATLDDIGLTAFLGECQHDVRRREGSLWSAMQLKATRRALPVIVDRPLNRALRDSARVDLAAVAIGVDPSGGDGPTNDEQGIVIVGRTEADAAQRHGFVLGDRSCKLAPEKWGARAVSAAIEYTVQGIPTEVVVESNYGGQMCVSTLRGAARKLGYGLVVRDHHGKIISTETGEAGILHVVTVPSMQNKAERANGIAPLYGDPDDPESWPSARMHHCDGVDLDELEDEMTGWAPDVSKSPNRMDALVLAGTRLMLATGARRGGLRMRDAA